MAVLEQIIEKKKEELITLRSNYRYRHFTEFEFFDRPVLSMQRSLTKSKDLAVIAEIKKASPSAGIIRQDFNPLEIAREYMTAGADAISVLTDRTFFQGSLEILNQIAQFRTLPLLRKDFIIDDMQIFESKANGADAVLLIAEILSATQIEELTHAAHEAGLGVLLEIHGVDQIQKIQFEHNPLIGINNRNLNDFSVTLDTTENISNVLPEDITSVAESGIDGEESVELIQKTRVDAILVGEFLMRQESVAEALRLLKRWCQRAD
jgi:indole-3-glycerol phosphate synthase